MGSRKEERGKEKEREEGGRIYSASFIFHPVEFNMAVGFIRGK